MLTGAERSSLALTLGFLILGSGIKLWRKAEVEIGPFPTASASAASLDTASDTAPDTAAGAAPASAETAPEPQGADSAAVGVPAPAPRTGAIPPNPAGGPVAARERAPKRKAPPPGKVDANRATAAELATVPGIGPKLAAAIVAYRREHGPFRNLGQLREVKGIGEKKWAAIAPCLALAPRGSEADGADGADGEGGEGGKVPR